MTHDAAQPSSGRRVQLIRYDAKTGFGAVTQVLKES